MECKSAIFDIALEEDSVSKVAYNICLRHLKGSRRTAYFVLRDQVIIIQTRHYILVFFT